LPDRWSSSSPKPYSSPIRAVSATAMRRNTVPSPGFCRNPSAPPSFASWSSI
jgi:hypothetical protein